jgi:hypothetical protein
MMPPLNPTDGGAAIAVANAGKYIITLNFKIPSEVSYILAKN